MYSPSWGASTNWAALHEKIKTGPHKSVSKMCKEVEAVLVLNRDYSREFFMKCFPELLGSIFKHPASGSTTSASSLGWLAQVSQPNQQAEAKALIEFLSPSGELMRHVMAADAEGVVKFSFPPEHLSIRTQQMLSTPAGYSALQKVLPYASCLPSAEPSAAVRGGAKVPVTLHLSVYQFFLFWTANYVVRVGVSGKKSMKNLADRAYNTHQGAMGFLHQPGRLFSGHVAPIQPYREIILHHLRHSCRDSGSLASPLSGAGALFGALFGVPQAVPGYGPSMPSAMGTRLGAYPGGGASGLAAFRLAAGGPIYRGEDIVAILEDFWLSDPDDIPEAFVASSPGLQGQLVAGRRGFPSSPPGGQPQQQQPHTPMRTLSYKAPTDDLVETIKLLFIYLVSVPPNASGDQALLQEQAAAAAAAAAQARAANGSARAGANGAADAQRAAGGLGIGAAPGAGLLVGGSDAAGRPLMLPRLLVQIQRPLYRTLLKAALKWPVEAPDSLTPLVELFIATLVPWNYAPPLPVVPPPAPVGAGASPLKGMPSPRAVLGSPGGFLSHGSPSAAGPKPIPEFSDKHRSYVLSALPFYTALLRHFLLLFARRAQIDIVAAARALDKVLGALELAGPGLVSLLRTSEVAYAEFLAKRLGQTHPLADAMRLLHAQMGSWELPSADASGAGGAAQGSPASPGMGPRTPGGGGYGIGIGMGGGGATPQGKGGLAPAHAAKLDMFQPGGGRELVLSLLRRIELEGENPDISASLRARLSSSSKAVFGITWPQQLSEPAPAPRARAGDDPSSPASSPRRGAIKPGEFREVHYHGDWMHRRVGDNEVGVLCRVLVRVSEAANRSLGLGPALRDKPAAEAPACLKAPDEIRSGVEWAISHAKARSLRINLRPLAEKQSLALLLFLYVFWGILRQLIWPWAAVGGPLGYYAYRGVQYWNRVAWPKVNRFLETVF